MEKPSNLKNSANPKKSLKVKFKTENLSNSSLLLADSYDPEDYEYLKTTDEKILFLTKLGLIFIVYSAIWVLIALYIIYYPDESNKDYLHKRLHVTIYIFIFISCGIKMIFSFLGFFLRSFAKFIFVIDLYLSYNIILGLYYYLNDDLKTSVISFGNYVLIGCFVFFANSIAFFLSTLLTHPRKIYNYYLGMVLMSFSTILALYGYMINKPMMSMGISRYYMIFFISSILNVYFCLNAYFVINYRTKKFYKFEYIYCFMCFWADWFSIFWIDVVGGKKNAEDDKSLEFSTGKESVGDYGVNPHVHSENDIENR